MDTQAGLVIEITIISLQCTHSEKEIIQKKEFVGCGLEKTSVSIIMVPHGNNEGYLCEMLLVNI